MYRKYGKLSRFALLEASPPIPESGEFLYNTVLFVPCRELLC